jgi:hypothetical protein
VANKYNTIGAMSRAALYAVMHILVKVVLSRAVKWARALQLKIEVWWIV